VKAKRLPTRREILSRYGLEHEVGPAKTKPQREQQRAAELEKLMRPRVKYLRSLERSLELRPEDFSDLIVLEKHIVDLEHRFRVAFGRQPGW